MNLRGLFALLLSVVFFPASHFAMHIIGGEITYECLGDGPGNSRRYKFTMKIYRDCNSSGAYFDNPAQMAIYRGVPGSGSFTMHQNFQLSNPLVTTIPPVPPECISQIPNVCVQQGVYVFERTLPILTGESYYVVYQRCCRNLTISNLITPGDVGATYSVELTAAAQNACNNSPVFKNFPPIIICKDFFLDFDHSAIDSDGDQLVYSFVAPLQGGGPLLQAPAVTSCNGAVPTPPCAPPFNNVIYAPPYSFNNPLGGNPPVTINTSSGLISGTPNMQGQFVVGVQVREFRNGVLLSEIRRDFQFNVADCKPNVLANISTDSIQVVGSKRFAIKSCGQNTIEFKNLSVDQSKITGWEWRFDLQNGTIFTENQNWNATVPFPDTGSYVGTLILNPNSVCNDTAHILVQIYPKVTASFEYAYDTCVAGPVSFTDLSFGDAQITKWDWRFGVPGGQSSLQNPDFLYPIPGNHPVRLRVVDKNICSDDTVQVINWFPVPPLIIVEPSSYLGCAPALIFFDNLSTPIDETYDIVWDFGDGTILTDTISPTHLYTEPGSYTVSVGITSPIGCFISATFPDLIRVEPSPIADFECDPSTGLTNFNNTVRFIDKSVDAARWNWQFDRFKTTIEQNPTFTFPDTGLMKVRLVVTHAEGCKDSMIKYLDIRPEVLWHMPNAFTPNGDGRNEGFLGKGFLDGATNFRMTIWNRWGELVFETNNPYEEWNGRAQNTGGMSPAGVYVYLVTFTGPRGEPFEFRGFATLVK
ncbi:MAG: gliding motility-associated C-terminal domain-containing protein [Saprospiraceae bacterium]|nr:gliding motility-associated C-terminal domain-containing protein [Saprospiraceae bacterium]